MSEIANQVDISKATLLGGWMSPVELTWLATKAQDIKIMVEFGSFHGRSARALADNCLADAKIYCVDPWNGEYWDDNGRKVENVDTYVLPYFKRNLFDHINSGRVITCRGFSYLFELPKGIKADMVFLDGDHRYPTVIKDIDKAKKLLKPNGLMCGHDYGHPLWWGVKKAVDENLTDVQTLDTIWWTRKF